MFVSICNKSIFKLKHLYIQQEKAGIDWAEIIIAGPQRGDPVALVLIGSILAVVDAGPPAVR